MLSDLGFLTGALHVLAGTAGVLIAVSHAEPMAFASVGGMAARLAAALWCIATAGLVVTRGIGQVRVKKYPRAVRHEVAHDE
jgi:hypothetical protein